MSTQEYEVLRRFGKHRVGDKITFARKETANQYFAMKAIRPVVSDQVPVPIAPPIEATESEPGRLTKSERRALRKARQATRLDDDE